VRAAAVVSALVAGLTLALPTLAVTVIGTSRSETLRGTAKADRISGRAGNDRIYGLGGDDILIGGPGRDLADGGPGTDRLLLRDGSPDTAKCGSGRDTATVDDIDTIRTDCEIVIELPPSGPVTPPPRPVVPGRYGGQTSQGESVAFVVTSGGSLTKLVFSAVHLRCDPGGGALAWALDLGDAVYAIRSDATFTVDSSVAGTVAGSPASVHIVVDGHLQSGLAGGSVTLEVRYPAAGPTTVCTASNVAWTAAAGILNEP
jgi:Ca2+-binding RTX toxin-like protein